MNPKAEEALVKGKAPLHLLERGVLEATARVLACGADKYGERNYRRVPVLRDTYVDAFLRHVLAWADGEELDPDTGEHHLAHVDANVHVVLGAERAGTLR